MGVNINFVHGDRVGWKWGRHERVGLYNYVDALVSGDLILAVEILMTTVFS